ncbi:hypothetical protein Tco_0549188 [Tanacetum coccineum]
MVPRKAFGAITTSASSNSSSSDTFVDKENLKKQLVDLEQKSGIVAKGFVAITLKCVRSQVQFLLGANNLEWPRQPPEKGGL